MHILLFIIYSFALGYGILRMPFFRNSGIRPRWLLLFFALHVAVGCLHNIIAYRYYPGHGDIWDFFDRSFVARYQLTSDLHMFIHDNSNWNYITHNGLVLVNVALNFLSFDNLSINTLLFSFPVFLGNIALFRVFRKQFPGDPLTALSVLLLPSTLFWTSCIHREGAVYSLLGFLLYYWDRFLSGDPGGRAHPPAPRRAIFYCFLLFIAVIYFRPAVALSLFPAVLIWWGMEKLPSRRLLQTTVAVIAGAGVLLFLLPGFSNFVIQVFSHRQKEFMILEGHSRLYLPELDGTWGSLWRVLPVAARNGLFEPLPGSGGQAIYTVFSLELIAIWGVMAGAIALRWRRRTPASRRSPVPPRSLDFPRSSASSNSPVPPPSPASSYSFSVACLFFALTGLLLIGMMIPFAGAIVRYRSIFLPFLLAPFLHTLCSTAIIKRWNRSLSVYIVE